MPRATNTTSTTRRALLAGLAVAPLTAAAPHGAALAAPLYEVSPAIREAIRRCEETRQAYNAADEVFEERSKALPPEAKMEASVRAGRLLRFSADPTDLLVYSHEEIDGLINRHIKAGGPNFCTPVMRKQFEAKRARLHAEFAEAHARRQEILDRTGYTAALEASDAAFQASEDAETALLAVPVTSAADARAVAHYYAERNLRVDDVADDPAGDAADRLTAWLFRALDDLTLRA